MTMQRPSGRRPLSVRRAEDEWPAALPFDYQPAKVQVPVTRPGTIQRTALVNRLRGAATLPLVSLAAPAGYGKTTVLSQWAERDDRPFAWISVDERDNDPLLLLRHVAAALHRLGPLDDDTLTSLASPGPSLWAGPVPRLASALCALPVPFVIVLDDASRLRCAEAIEVVTALARHLPARSTLALAGRVPPELPLSSLRAGGRLLEVGTELLALSRREAYALLQAMGAELDEATADALFERTEGWAAGLYLAALALQDAGAEADVDVIGSDRFLAGYFHLEYLAGRSPEELAFLRATSILDEMSGPLCDAVLGRRGSAAMLESIERANMFLVPADRRRDSYRYHHLFRDLLGSDLRRYEPELVPALHRRAAEWFEAKDDPEAAVAHAAACGDFDRLAAVVASNGLRVCDAGGLAVVEGWLRLFGNDELRRHPEVALLGAWVRVLGGRSIEAAHCLLTAEVGIASVEEREPRIDAGPWVALVRAALCDDGADLMAADAQAALVGFEPDSRWRVPALMLRGAALALRGDAAPATAVLDDAIAESEIHGAVAEGVASLGERALIALECDDREGAERLAAEIRQLVSRVGSGGVVSGAFGLAVSARVRLRAGGFDEARRELADAGRPELLPPETLAWLALRTRIELARTHLMLRDADAACTHLAAARGLLDRRPGLGVLLGQVAELDSEAGRVASESGRYSGFTTAELRLLPFLATHLSFREIGFRLHVSRNTIKTQAISVYRKLGASSRSEAIAKAERLGLLEERVSA
jgi:LuxR family maltose regulon positive regulatory protein